MPPAPSQPPTAVSLHSAKIGLQEPPVGVRVAADARGALVRKAFAGARFDALDLPAHLIPWREAESPREGGGDPLALRLHHREQAAGRVDEAGEVEPVDL